MTHEKFMRVALQLAEKGRGKVSPNPMVGAVVVKGGKIVGRGFHRAFGKAHAEVNAIDDAGASAKGSTLYVTLEPCTNYGHTPPCVDTIISSGIRTVVIGSKDPNPLVNGRGTKMLKRSGISVVTGVLPGECVKLNEGYFSYVKTGRPLIILKIASTLDGKIALQDGSSRWITGIWARSLVHRLRSKVDGIVVGVNTVIRDDPLLTSRGGRNPGRIVLDSTLRIPESARLLKSIDMAPLLIATTGKAPSAKVKRLTSLGATVMKLDEDSCGRINLPSLLRELPGKGILSLMVESGREVITSFLKQGIGDRLCLFLSPKVVGGENSLSWVGDIGVTALADSIFLRKAQIRTVGKDFMIEGTFK
ncbi:MAG: bifunctional diaminohydroxyphosphoribosylaminopyrimidine deaminase/5-amino-6-(5-phosphoribosylamino)uracil reductase RibD [Candidatus Eisenbacteria bacterium]|nr:bifunctional diaminohydroxyphosphoribosylaminopyrimidine deaminase/5-amino-6-(5-phosphoribosylamino)uracil reductase RibD [Candidatus Eisenbacteria bacterium]